MLTGRDMYTRSWTALVDCVGVFLVHKGRTKTETNNTVPRVDGEEMGESCDLGVKRRKASKQLKYLHGAVRKFCV